jgi:hypothetical protein
VTAGAGAGVERTAAPADNRGSEGIAVRLFARIHPIASPSRAARSLAALLAAAAVALAVGPAAAGIPDPRYCDVDTFLVLAPAGDYLYPVVLRDESYAPIRGSAVALDFSSAPGIVLCPSSDPEGDRLVLGTTDSQGRVEFRVRGGGQSEGPVAIRCIGQTVGFAYPRSTDLNGDLTVTQADADLHAALPADARAGDYNRDGASDATDRLQITSQIGHDCQSVTVLSSTWGRVKAVYR